VSTGKGLTVVATVLEGDYLQNVNDVLRTQQVVLEIHRFKLLLYALFAEANVG